MDTEIYAKHRDKHGDLVLEHIHSYIKAELWHYRKRGAEVGFERILREGNPLGWDFYIYIGDERLRIFGILYEPKTFDDEFFKMESVIKDAVQKVREEEI